MIHLLFVKKKTIIIHLHTNPILYLFYEFNNRNTHKMMERSLALYHLIIFLLCIFFFTNIFIVLVHKEKLKVCHM